MSDKTAEPIIPLRRQYAQLQALAHTLIKREQLDAILLAGTDLSSVFTPKNAVFLLTEHGQTSAPLCIDFDLSLSGSPWLPTVTMQRLALR
jgi:tRNA pseudouridine-54 N-methylase